MPLELSFEIILKKNFPTYPLQKKQYSLFFHSNIFSFGMLNDSFGRLKIKDDSDEN